MLQKRISYLLAAVALGCSVLALIFAAASYLDGRNTGQSASAAYRLVPFNAEYATRLSGWQPERRTELLRRAVRLNPFQVQALLQLGFDFEFRRGDREGAERYYRNAEAVDHMYLPKWTLTNFYFRQGKERSFLTWANASLQITPYSPDPIFAELWASDIPAVLREDAVPDRPGILDQYLMFLFNAGKWDVLPSVLERLVRVAGDDPYVYGLNDVIGPMLDRLVGERSGEIAARMWDALSRVHWIPFSPVQSQPIMNGDFSIPLWSHGFDWHPVTNEGVRFGQDYRKHEAQITLSGDEGEDISLLEQWIHLSSDQTYKLSWRLVTQDLSNPSGLSWRIQFGQKQANSPDFGLKGTQSWIFQSGQTSQPSLLTLRYVRPIGTTRNRGVLHLMAVSVQKP